jgi:hypothetical protein
LADCRFTFGVSTFYGSKTDNLLEIAAIEAFSKHLDSLLSAPVNAVWIGNFSTEWLIIDKLR